MTHPHEEMDEEAQARWDAAAHPPDLHLSPHTKWMHAFDWWYHNAERDRIYENLRGNVLLSNQNCNFLKAIFEGRAKPLSGKQLGLARFKSSITDNKIKDLTAQRKSHSKICDATELSMAALHKRLYPPKPKACPTEKHAELSKKFDALYKRFAIK